MGKAKIERNSYERGLTMGFMFRTMGEKNYKEFISFNNFLKNNPEQMKKILNVFKDWEIEEYRRPRND